MKNLVLSVGGTVDPLVKSIELIKPNRVIFIASQETKSNIIKDVISLTKEREPQYKHQIITLEDAEDLHEAFLAGYKAKVCCEEGDIYVDYTGGTKSMSVGLALSFFGKDIKEYRFTLEVMRDKKKVLEQSSQGMKSLFKKLILQAYIASILQEGLSSYLI